MCSSGVGFDPVINGEALEFDVAGLYDGLFVMSDRSTGSVWTHYDGTVLTGPLADTGTRLTTLPLHHKRWSDWLAEHPDTKVLAWEDKYADRYWDTEPGAPGLGQEFLDTIRSLDDRLPENELVFGLALGGESRAYRFNQIDEPTLIQTEINGEALVMVLDPDGPFGVAYQATTNGEIREFQLVQGKLVDSQGNQWNLDGTGEGGSLTWVTGLVTEWYGWAAYHPETQIVDLTAEQ
ncbi:MAG: DUF3179 domain-containing protein [Actinobacteria bacterium]|nr:DUF3179 domain-containing protein [Actinomycetota bacterium]MBT3746321.1 DUF3179 domain-containing protein [Actinomycetota bacterium]MBT3969636.1 DUF3179 domain-containing protein [Actinomycetota bacterium]MBT4008837.1 DUF3179 domain-containing protein [Actinomycetota bacterium]MBT4302819.1 DUF3179 domain-containing protein [Actinomycetota bacterium]